MPIPDAEQAVVSRVKGQLPFLLTGWPSGGSLRLLVEDFAWAGRGGRANAPARPEVDPTRPRTTKKTAEASIKGTRQLLSVIAVAGARPQNMDPLCEPTGQRRGTVGVAAQRRPRRSLRQPQVGRIDRKETGPGIDAA